MGNHSGRKDSFAGGLGILAVTAALCLKRLKKLDRHFREQMKKRENEGR